LGNIAADLAVNELVPITPGSCEPEIGKDGKRTWYFVDDLRKIPKFKDIKNMQSAEWYYNFLMERTQAGNGGQSGIPGKAGDDHAGWNPDDTIANERVKAHVDYIDKNDLWGDVSASDQEVIKAAQTRPINWQAILKMLIGAFAWHERESTRKRINRRTGFIHPGYRKLKVDRVLVVVDTSGSTFMYNLLGRFLSLINSMTDTCPIDLMQCDCRITEEPQPFEQYQNEFTFKGNGGTSFDPIIKLVDERGYRMVVILTDGQASVCPEPQSARVVWVTPQGMKPPVDWGIRVEMESYD
jgi:predicted metal-dependent peptidase